MYEIANAIAGYICMYKKARSRLKYKAKVKGNKCWQTFDRMKEKRIVRTDDREIRFFEWIKSERNAAAIVSK